MSDPAQRGRTLVLAAADALAEALTNHPADAKRMHAAAMALHAAVEADEHLNTWQAREQRDIQFADALTGVSQALAAGPIRNRLLEITADLRAHLDYPELSEVPA